MVVDFPKFATYSEPKKGFLYEANKTLRENPTSFMISAHKTITCCDLILFCKKKFRDLRQNKI